MLYKEMINIHLQRGGGGTIHNNNNSQLRGSSNSPSSFRSVSDPLVKSTDPDPDLAPDPDPSFFS
jgi:hypothetical protein